MLYRIEIGPRPDLADIQGQSTARAIKSALGVEVKAVWQLKIFTVDGLEEGEVRRLVDEGIWHDPILQVASITPLPLRTPKPDWFVEVGFRPGVTDNEARTARDTAALVLERDREGIHVYTAVQYQFVSADTPLTLETVKGIAEDQLCNGLIQRYRIKSAAEWEAEPGFAPQAAKVTGAASSQVDIIELSAMDDSRLMEMSRANTWALNLTEMKTIRDHFADEDEAKRRAALDLPANPTDLEMEVMAQTWSEHCKHKIFASKVAYENKETGRKENIDNLYKTCIRDTTARIREQLGDEDFCRSVFKDNAGVIAFSDEWDACIKVETHNSPSALDPYGGALTGIVGVNRDPMGTGMGANLLCNTDVFCFASPFYDKELPPRLLHPRRVFEGVRCGVEHGGNKSGIPTVNGSIVFDERYLGKPLVYCGTVGMLPARLKNGQPGWKKKAEVNDCIVMVGGRIGKDGIHGATFSSEELNENSPATAVQIGDPITQRKMYDFILRARDMGLYHAITDNGAGGLSSSVGEMAEDTGGCVLDISLAPLKYDGLRPWEILVSEAQERMTLAVPKEHVTFFCKMAKEMDVEATVLGHFTDSGFFEVRYGDRVVGSIGMDFMHDGVPQLSLKAAWERPEHKDVALDDASVEQGNFLKAMLGRLNICSKEYVIRQYDHEVKGGSVIKPLCGVERDAPADAGVLRPVLTSEMGLVVSHGICPRYSDYDTYWMMANAMDEAIRNAVCVGGNPDFMAGVDNFCWCDPVESERTPDGQYKMAQLVRACKALQHFSLAYGVPCISGKDSMKNDYMNAGIKISIPPTVLFSVIGVINNVVATQTSDFKKKGQAIYMFGATRRELGGSEAALELGLSGGMIPTVDAQTALPRYRAIHGLMGQRAISACHDCSDGGLAVALAEMCIGGRLGCDIDLDLVPVCGAPMSLTELLYSESASRMIVTVRPDITPILDVLGQWQICRRIGTVTDDGVMTVRTGSSTVISEKVDDLARAFKKTLDW